MNKTIKYKWVRFVFLLFISVLLAACALSAPRYWPEKTSRVLDIHTKKPIKDVYVVAGWVAYGGGLVGSQTTCYHVESAKSNEKGEFTIPSYTEGFGAAARRHINLVFYSPKYKVASNQKIGPYYKHDYYYLEKFTGTEKERFSFIKPTSCHGARESRRNTFEFNKAVYEEAKMLAKTQEEKKKVKWLRKIMASTIDTSYRKFTGDEEEKRINEILKDFESREQKK